HSDCFFFSSRRRHTRSKRDWSSDVCSSDLAIFNLGYLPRGDKTIITTPASTIAAIKKLLQFIRLSGRIALVIYHGHPGGQEEKNEVLSFVTSLSQAHYEVVQYA